MSIPAVFFLLLVVSTSQAAAIGPNVAGSFYPADPDELRRAVDGLLADVATAPVAGKVAGLLVPHAGYVFSGPTAARGFKLLKGRRGGTVLILAAGHYLPVRGAATVSSGTFRTPLGEVPVDAAAAARLRALSPLIEDMPEAFAREHSVEVELPFLQRVLGRFQVAPLLLNSDDPETIRAVGAAVAEFLKRGDALLIVSSDLSHYPEAEVAAALDGALLAALTETPQDPEFFWRTGQILLRRGAKGHETPACGGAAMLAAAHAMQRLGAWPRLLHYTHSGDTPAGDRGRVVGYAAVAWTRGPAPKPRPLSAAQRTTLLRLARETLADKLQRGRDPIPALWKDPALNVPAAVFVTLRRRGVPRQSSLRGCIGTLAAAQPLAEAVQAYALQSALHDSRFPPVEAAELDGLVIDISRLSPPRPAASHREIRSGQGVTLRQGRASGVFLPSVWEDLPDKARFLGELCEQKAGLPRDCWQDPATQLEVFDAEDFSE